MSNRLALYPFCAEEYLPSLFSPIESNPTMLFWTTFVAVPSVPWLVYSFIADLKVHSYIKPSIIIKKVEENPNDAQWTASQSTNAWETGLTICSSRELNGGFWGIISCILNWILKLFPPAALGAVIILCRYCLEKEKPGIGNPINACALDCRLLCVCSCCSTDIKKI